MGPTGQMELRATSMSLMARPPAITRDPSGMEMSAWPVSCPATGTMTLSDAKNVRVNNTMM